MSNLSIMEDRHVPSSPTTGLAVRPRPGESIDDCASMLSRYRQLRDLDIAQNRLIVKLLDKPQLHEGAAKLGLLQGNVLNFDAEEDTGALFEYCNHDVWRNGRNALGRYLADSPPPADSAEMMLLQAKLSAVFSMFVVEKVGRGVGVEVRDLIRGDSRALMDVSLGNCADSGVVACARLMEVEGISMTTGTLIAGDVATYQRVMAALERKGETSSLLEDAPERRSAATALIIRHFMAYRIALRRSLEAQPEPQRIAPVRSSPKVGRNDPCPCGSGIKYKKCCG